MKNIIVSIKSANKDGTQSEWNSLLRTLFSHLFNTTPVVAEEVPHLVLTRGYPILTWLGVPQSSLAISPHGWDWGNPGRGPGTRDLGKILGLGYCPTLRKGHGASYWGVPHPGKNIGPVVGSIMAPYPPPSMWTDTHHRKQCLPYPSDADSNEPKNVNANKTNWIQ